jgi:Flp pilus assembly pilin Flp
MDNRFTNVACLGRLTADRRGVTVVEYALMCALLALVIITGIFSYGNSLGGLMSSTFAKIGDAL